MNGVVDTALHSRSVRLVFQAKERRNERMSQQNQSIAEELQKQRAAKTRQEVEVSRLRQCCLLLCSYAACMYILLPCLYCCTHGVCVVLLSNFSPFLGLINAAFSRGSSLVCLPWTVLLSNRGCQICQAVQRIISEDTHKIKRCLLLPLVEPPRRAWC